MTRIFAGSLGSDKASVVTVPAFPAPWNDVLASWCPEGLRPVQAQALPSVIIGCQHIVITAPTNSGKSLCAYAELLRCCISGQRAVLVEPMRVIANEQSDRLAAFLVNADLKLTRFSGSCRFKTDTPLSH